MVVKLNRIWVTIFASLFLANCSKIPPIPELETTDSLPDRVVLDGDISVSDVKALFSSLNRSGKLSGLTPYIEKVPDSTLRKIGPVFHRLLLENQDVGLVNAIEQLNRSRDFSRWHSRIHNHHTHIRALLSQTLKANHAKTLAQRTLSLLEEETYQTLKNWIQSASDSVQNLRYPTSPPLTFSSLSQDINHLTKYQAHGNRFIQKLQHKDLGIALEKAASSSNPNHLLGFGFGFSKLWNSPTKHSNELDELFALLGKLEEPTQGLFRLVQDRLVAEPDSIRELSAQLQGFIPQTVAGLVLDSFRNGLMPYPPLDGDTWKQTAKTLDQVSELWKLGFMVFRTALDSLVPLSPFGTDLFLRDLSLNLNALALANWLEATAIANPIPKHFRGALWELPIQQLPDEITLAESDDDGVWKLTPGTESKFNSVGLSDYIEPLKEIIQKEGFGNFYYEFSQNDDSISLEKALTQAIKDVNDYRSMGDFTPFLKTLVHELTTGTFQISDWDSDSLLKTINGWILPLDERGLQKLSQLCFDQWRIHDLDLDNREIITRYFKSSKDHLAKIEAIFDGMKYLKTFMDPSQGELAPVNLYHRWLKKLPFDDFSAVGDLVSLLNQVPLLNSAKFPTLHQQLGNGRLISAGLLGVHSTGSTGAIAQALWSVARPISGTHETGFSAAAEWAADLADNTPSAFRWAVESLPDEGWDLQEESPDVRQWIGELASKGDLVKLWNFFETQGSWNELHTLLDNLEVLAENGYLFEALSRVSQFRDLRIQRLGNSGMDWVKSGEFLEFIGLARKLLPSTLR